MNAGPQTTAAHDTTVRCRADIDVHFSRSADGAGVFRFDALDPDHVEVDSDGTIRLRAILRPDERAELTFTLVADSGEALEYEGIRLGSSEQQAVERPPAIDTADAYYFDTPFKVANGGAERVSTLILTQVGPLAPSHASPHYYLLALRDGEGRSYRHDPKIYNEGDGGPR